MTPRKIVTDTSGFALLLVLLLTMVVGALALFSITMLGNTTIINIHSEKQAQMEAAALSGTEMGRVLVNRSPSLYPETGYVKLPSKDIPLEDASGKQLTGYSREVYVGPSGVATGQFGVFGSVVSVVSDARGPRSVFRREMAQESFAKYAYFTNWETLPNGTPIVFAPGDQLFGPVHSNDRIEIMNTANGAVFHGPVTTHKTVVNAHRAQFRQGYQAGTARINLPDVAELSKLRQHAQQGTTAFTSSTAGSVGTATTRIEFIAIDIDGDGEINGENEGFIKVYRAASTSTSGARWVVAGRTSPVYSIPNCGHRHPIGGREYFYTAAEHDTNMRDAGGQKLEGNSTAILAGQHGHRTRCYLGGSDSLTTDLSFRADDGRGSWQKWSGSWASPMPAVISARDDREYLIPLGRAYNPNFKGVIHVTGHVAISGVLRGRVTLATTGDIVIADDITYATDPAAASCQDILGLFAGGDIVVADNSINAPMRFNSGTGNNFRSYDDTTDEVIHAVLLTLGSFYVANYDSGATNTEKCEGVNAGRGCLYVTGGIIQDRRGPVGMSSGTGYLKRYSYDQCAASNPPPYYPTTGYFAPGRIFEVDPTNFDIDDLFSRITAG